MNPTFSFKDRPVAIAATRARAFGFDTIACASTGNLAAAVAACGARASLHAVVFVIGELFASGRKLSAPLWNGWGIGIGFFAGLSTDFILIAVGA